MSHALSEGAREDLASTLLVCGLAPETRPRVKRSRDCFAALPSDPELSWSSNQAILQDGCGRPITDKEGRWEGNAEAGGGKGQG